MSDTIPYVEARYFTHANRTAEHINYIVIHDMEAPEENIKTAENVANWFAGSTSSRASTHYNIDTDSIVQSVKDKNVAWGAASRNHDGLHFELAGYARQSREEWLDENSMKILKRAASLAAKKAEEYNIPKIYVGAEGIKQGLHGFIGHVDANLAQGVKGGHWDPGPHFPWDIFMSLVRGETVVPTPTPIRPKPVSDLLRRGDRGQRVADWQKILVGAKLLGPRDIDGIFGPRTEAATKAFQVKLKVSADGIVGPSTRAATKKLLEYVAGLSPSVNRPTIRRGSTGVHVRYLQQKLGGLSVDGVFGSKTEAAVKSFQRSRKLSVDGIVGPNTWRAIG